MTKLCPKCKQERPRSEFYKSSTRDDGLQRHCKKCSHNYYVDTKEHHLVLCHENVQRLRLVVLAHYGNGSVACVHCGESNPICLSIDHIHGRGSKHHRDINVKGGVPFYRWLKIQGFPEGYQTLCMNCQFKKRDKSKEHGGGRPSGY